MSGSSARESDTFADQLAAGLAGYGPRPFIEFERTWYTGNDIAVLISAIEDTLRRGGVLPGEPVALVVRNRIAHAAAVLGFIATQRPVSMIYSYQSETAIAADIRDVRPAALLADPVDLGVRVLDAVREVGGVAVELNPQGPVPRSGPRTSPGPSEHSPSGFGISMLTSGTTGPPKRISIPTAVLAHTVSSMTLGQSRSSDDPPTLAFWPFGSVGVCQLLAGAFAGQRIVLLEKFSVDEWVRSVKEYRIQWTGVAPAVVRMLLAADVPKADLASLSYLPGGGGPLEPGLQHQFERTYGIPLLWGYGATEFAGTVCSWTPELRERFGDSKPGTVGRSLPGVQVRILDPDTGRPVTSGRRGYLAARVDALGPDWITTTDIASVDDDGFVTIHGRGDGAINRGGFKVLPERVRDVLLTHPAVADAAVVAAPHPRLGEVPFAAVERHSALPAPGERELKDLVRESLPAQYVPVAVAILDKLPRNAAMKVRVDAVAALYRPHSPC